VPPEYRARRALQGGRTAISVSGAIGAKLVAELGCQIGIGRERTGELFSLGDFCKPAANPQQDRIARVVVILGAFDLCENVESGLSQPTMTVRPGARAGLICGCS
jgi:hypothetical protein